MDLRQEIEARRAQVEELRRRRQATESVGSTSSGSDPSQVGQSVPSSGSDSISENQSSNGSSADSANPQPASAEPTNPTTNSDSSGADSAGAEHSNSDSAGSEPANQPANQPSNSEPSNSEPTNPPTNPESASAETAGTVPTEPEPEPVPNQHTSTQTAGDDSGSPSNQPQLTFRVVESDGTSLLGFADTAWRAIARSQSASAFRNYAQLGETALAAHNPELREFARISGQDRVVWSPHFPELVATRSSDPRMVCVFALDAPGKPEFTLRSPTVLTTAPVFHPKVPRYLYCGGKNGQILMWDLGPQTSTSTTHYGLLPQRKSTADGSRIVSLQFEADTLISLAENGVLSVWPGGDRLARAQHRIVLDDALRHALSELRIGALVPVVCTTCFPANFGAGLGYGTGLTVVSSVTGHLLLLPALPSAPSVGFSHWRHKAPVTALHFRPAAYTSPDGRQFAILVSAGLDWHARVWIVSTDGSAEPILAAELSIDFAPSTAKWHPKWLSVLVIAGEDQCQLWDLNRSLVAPWITHTETLTCDAEFGPNAMLAVATAEQVSAFRFPEADDSDFWLQSRNIV